jgi:hypothetical protein
MVDRKKNLDARREAIQKSLDLDKSNWERVYKEVDTIINTMGAGSPSTSMFT